ncbi:Enterobactin exporter EntS [Streptomyces antimycoticus]
MHRWWGEGEPFARATVVATWHSSPLPPGTSMLVGPDGALIGSVSGGCVEGAVYELAQEVTDSGRPVVADELPAAGALQSTVAQTGMIIGPLLAGALIPVLGLPTLYLIDAVALYITRGPSCRRLPALPPLAEGAGGGGQRAGWRDVVDGFRYIAAHRILLMSFLADIIAMVFGMPRALFPQLASHTYAPWGEGFALGLLFAAIPIGAVAGGLLSGTFSLRPATV